MTTPLAAVPGALTPGVVPLDAVGTPLVLGISCDYHDAAAALVAGPTIVGAAAEERFTRTKHDPSLPRHAATWLLRAAGIEPDGLDALAFYAKPLSSLERTLVSHGRAGLRGVPSLSRALRGWGRSKVWVDYRLEKLLDDLGHRRRDLIWAEHHQSHAAAAFYPSPFETAAVLTFDGVGEWATSTIGRGVGTRVELQHELRYPDSIGLWYSAMTAYCGFAVNDGEYKLMGLAPYGTPRYVDALREHLVHVHDDGSIHLPPRWYRYLAGDQMVAGRTASLLGGPPRRPDQPVTEREADLAASVQVVLEDIVLRAARHAHAITGERRACLAGGVALNCVANRRLREDGPFDELWIQPAAGDDGGALGAALWATHHVLGTPRPPSTGDAMAGALLGPAFDDDAVAAWLTAAGIAHQRCDDARAANRALARRIADGAIAGCARGRMEFGPRALGNRSILADPRRADMVATINQRVKGREGFRPFAPAVTAEAAGEWFDLPGSSPYMLQTAAVRGARRPPDDGAFGDRLAAVGGPLPACTHVDGSARVQTVDADVHPEFHDLLDAFASLTGVPVLLNTSFNVADEPIVCTPGDALRGAARAGLDVVLLGTCLVDRPAEAIAP